MNEENTNEKKEWSAPVIEELSVKETEGKGASTIETVTSGTLS